MNDAELRNMIRQVDVPVALLPDAASRVQQRMMDRYEADLEHRPEIEIIHLEEAGPARRKPGGSLWLAVAAGLLVILGVVVATPSAEEPSGDFASQPGTTTPSAVLHSSLPQNLLGLEETTTYAYWAFGENNQDQIATVQLRPGRFDTDEQWLAARRNVSYLGTSETNDLTISFDPNAVPVVPVEFLDPLVFGGLCTGGEIGLRAQTETIQVSANCNGVNVPLVIEVELGAIQALPLLATPIEARPLTYRITPSGSPTRVVTLWIAERGLVRITATIDDAPLDLNLTPASLLAMEGPQ